jgi:hypothetical protein
MSNLSMLSLWQRTKDTRQLGWIVYLLGLTLLTSVATAQPMLVTEHDWTFSVRAGRYGVCQWNIAPGDLNRHTTIYCGGALLTLRMRARDLTALVFVPVATVGAFVLGKRSRKKNPDDQAV